MQEKESRVRVELDLFVGRVRDSSTCQLSLRLHFLLFFCLTRSPLIRTAFIRVDNSGVNETPN